MAAGDHQLSAALRVWEDVLPEFQGSGVSDPVDGVLVASDDLKKVTKWLQHTTTKFGASASVADGADRNKALKPIAEEVIKAFTAAVGTLLSIKKGAGVSLLNELRETGAGLANAVDNLGRAAATEGDDSVPMLAGMVLDRSKAFERVSVQNRAAIRRRLLRSLAQMRDANREMRLALDGSNAKGDGAAPDDEDLLSGDDDFGDEALEPEERRVVEAIVEVAQILEDVLKEASQVCVPGSGGPSIAELEAAANAAVIAAQSVDSLAVHSSGGIEVENLKKSFEELRSTIDGLRAVSPAIANIDPLFDKLKVAIDTA